MAAEAMYEVISMLVMIYYEFYCSVKNKGF